MGTTFTYQRPSKPPADREVTPEELYFNQQWGRCELVDGKVLQMSPAGYFHGEIVGALMILIGSYVRNRKLGKVYDGQTGFVYPDGRTVRSPDVMFVSAARLPRDRTKEGYLPISPNFAVEVVSPDDSYAEVTRKAESYLSVGVELVWVVEPKDQEVHVYRPGRPVEVFHADGVLTAEPALPKFTLPVREIFEE